MMSYTDRPMKAHPRLLATPSRLKRLTQPPKSPLLKQAAKLVAAMADGFARSHDLVYDPALHNAHLLRAREMQRRVVTLLVRWKQTGREIYRQAALEDIRAIGGWGYWGWHMWLEKNPDPNADFDLSYGENSTTLALAYDWLYSTLTDEERAMFHQIAAKWVFRPFLAMTGDAPNATKRWWFKNDHSNWNTVCAGGAGMAALAFHEELPDAAEVLRRAEISVIPYIQTLEATAGGWIEGIGYWNYGHRYAFLYLLSHECATGKRHPLLKLRGVNQTLDFPIDFCPARQPCSFGDVNGWSPLPFHYAVAERLGRKDLFKQLDSLSQTGAAISDSAWPNAAELLLFHPRSFPPARAPRRMVRKIYPQLDWGILADRLPDPGLYFSVRGGKSGTGVPHGHSDLLSFHCVVGGERLIDNLGINGGNAYLDTTFSNRRFELFETSPVSKNTLLINGVGVNNPATSVTTPLSGPGWNGIRIDVTGSIHWKDDPSLVPFCARLFLFVEGPFALIIDRAQLKQAGRMEARFHTYSKVKTRGDRAKIHRHKKHLGLAFTATVPSALYRAEDALTTPIDDPCTMLRWSTVDRTHTEIIFATLLTPGQGAGRVEIKDAGGHLLVKAHCKDATHTFKITKDLKSVRRVVSK